MGGRGEPAGTPGVTVPGLREDRERFREPPAPGCRGREKRDVSAHGPKVRLGPREPCFPAQWLAPRRGLPRGLRVACGVYGDRVPVHSRPAGLYSAGLGYFPVVRSHSLLGGNLNPELGSGHGAGPYVQPLSRKARPEPGVGDPGRQPESRGVRGRGQKSGLLTGTPGARCRPRGEHSSHPVDGCADSNTIAVNCERRRRAGAEYNRGRCLLGSLGWCHILRDGYYYYSLPVGNVTGTRTN